MLSRSENLLLISHLLSELDSLRMLHVYHLKASENLNRKLPFSHAAKFISVAQDLLFMPTLYLFMCRYGQKHFVCLFIFQTIEYFLFFSRLIMC